MDFSSILNIIKAQYPDQDFIPLHVPKFNGAEKEYLTDCIDSTFVSSVGAYVNGFEDALAQYTGVKKAILCVNGTNAIHLCLKLANVEFGDEVITQPLTFIATTNAITYAGAVPVFLDVDKDTMGLSPEALSAFLGEYAEVKNGVCWNKSSGKKIKACMPMHTFGHACRIEEIVSICKEYHIEVVEDAAEAMGSWYKGKHLGTFGKLSAISFNGNKIMTTGGGGVILTNDEDVAARAKHLSTQAKIPHQWEYAHDEIGYNYRMPNINAALGLAQLEQLPEFLKSKKNLAKKYKSAFDKIDGLTFFTKRDDEDCNHWLNAIIFNSIEERDAFLEVSNNNGVMTRPIWKLMTKMPMFNHCYSDDLTNAQWLEDRVVNIPSSVT